MGLRADQVLFFNKFGHLYDSGVPLAEALDLVRADLHSPLREAVAQIIDDLYRGTNFADAMEQRTDIFAHEVVGVIRSGEGRGDLGNAARSAAAGLEGGLFDATVIHEDSVDALLEQVGDARALHIEPDGVLRARIGGRLADAGGVDKGQVEGLCAGLARRARMRAATGEGSFLWQDRLVRVSLASTLDGPTAVVRLSGEPGEEPAEARAWRAGPPGLLLVLGDRNADIDACLRAILRPFQGKRVAVDLPVPEVLGVNSVDHALALDPDVVCVARVWRDSTARRLDAAVAEGVHVVASAATALLFGGAPTTIHLG